MRWYHLGSRAELGLPSSNRIEFKHRSFNRPSSIFELDSLQFEDSSGISAVLSASVSENNQKFEAHQHTKYTATVDYGRSRQWWRLKSYLNNRGAKAAGPSPRTFALHTFCRHPSPSTPHTRLAPRNYLPSLHLWHIFRNNTSSL
ncbi:hypothetical protein EVAR_89251_1 [Eumeta japonica]|uniref:Uncharacterized protein n=1 Tax=Eumeta variegata TaxID=151549 RepID=A0A4C1VK78_EUMVA|nr:hypothetical protein EVAR_89251_1 [Eumeta japonica]